MTVPTHTLNDGHEIPALGFGTYPLRGDAGRDAILSALEVGYRLLDTAVNYRNEREVGEALRASGLPREQVFVTSKLPGDRKSTRLNSSHANISYAVFCLKKKNIDNRYID